MTNSKKTQRKVALILVLSLLIPLMNYQKQSVKADSTKTTTTTTSSTIGEISATDEVELVEDFTNSPVLKYVNAESFVKNNHVKRLKDEEELNTYMFKNADGTKTMYMMYENVKYIDKFGNVKDKDISLKLDNDTYRVNDNNVALSIPTTPQNGIEVNYDNNIVKITPVRNLTASKIVTIMENNAVTYKNYYGTGIDLRYTPLLSGVKEDIILSEYTGQEYKFTLETNGLNIYEKEGRYYLAKDEQSESIYDIGEVLVYDAVGRSKTSEEIKANIDWCVKMFERVKRSDAEGMFRWHWVLIDSLEIFCDAVQHPYLGPKKSLSWMKENHPKAFACYEKALSDFTVESLSDWISYLKNMV